MTKHLTIKAGLAVALLTAVSGAAHATGLAHTYVSTSGSDANSGLVTAPCKTFAGAYAKTAAGGEIDVLKSGDYGPLTITTSLTINGEGADTSITPAVGAAAIVVNAGNTDTVVVKNVSFKGGSDVFHQALYGFQYQNAGLLDVENCTFTGWFNVDVWVSLTGTGETLTVDKSDFAGSAYAVYIASTSAAPVVSLTDDTFESAYDAVFAATGSVDIEDSLIAQSINYGLYALDGGSISAERCILTGNDVAVVSSPSSHVRLADCDLFNNTTGIQLNAGVVSTAMNNKLAGNGTAGAPNATINLE